MKCKTKVNKRNLDEEKWTQVRGEDKVDEGRKNKNTLVDWLYGLSIHVRYSYWKYCYMIFS